MEFDVQKHYKTFRDIPRHSNITQLSYIEITLFTSRCSQVTKSYLVMLECLVMFYLMFRVSVRRTGLILSLSVYPQAVVDLQLAGARK